MGVIKNDVGRSSNKTIMMRKILSSILIILIIITVLLIFKIINDKYLNNKESSLQKDPNIKLAENIMNYTFGNDYGKYFEYSDEEEIIFNDEDFKTFIAIMNTKPVESSYSCKDLFSKDFDMQKIENTSGSYFIEKGDFKANCDDYSNFYSYDDVNKEYKNLFGNTKSALKDQIDSIFTDLYAYSSSKNVYSKVSCECDDGGFNPVGGVTRMYENNGVVHIEYVNGIAYWINPVNDDTKLKLLDNSYVLLSSDEVKKTDLYLKYKDKLPKYDFQFIEEDGIYKFNKIEKIK